MSGSIPMIRRLLRWVTRESWQLSLERMAQKKVDRTLGLATYDGIHGCASMVLDLSDRYEWRIFLNMRDAASLRVLRQVLEPGDTFVDAGANIGHFTVLAAHLVGGAGKVHCFEPQPAALDRLRRNIAMNHPERVEVHPVGLWDQPGSMEMHIFEESGHHTASVGLREDRTVRETVTIPTVRMDDVIHGPVKLIKVDVEGADWHALRGAKRVIDDSRPHLILEVNNNVTRTFGYPAMAMVDWVLEHWPGYRMHRMTRLETRRVTRDELDRDMREKKTGYYNVWFQPT